MSEMSFGAYCALIAIGLFAIVDWVFVFRYKRRPWNSTREGKTIMFMKVCLGLVTTIFFVFRFFMNGPEWQNVRWATYTILFLSMTWLMVNLNRYLLNKDHDERGNATASDA